MRDEAARRLRAIAALDAPALAADAARFAAAYGGAVGILPPDQYLSLVLRLSEGCSWNACTFCSFYRDIPFRVKTVPELLHHVAAVRSYFGLSLALRRGIFLGDANALCVGHDRLLPLLEAVVRAFPIVPPALGPGERRAWLHAHPEGASGLFAFVDAWTGHRKGETQYRAYAKLGLKRVYVGLESGDPGLLAWLEKAGSPEEAVDLVSTLHAAGIAAGVIVLLGAGGERYHEGHVRHTARVLGRMGLGATDLVYFSEFVMDADLGYAGRASTADLLALSPEGCADQRRAILEAWGPPSGGPRPRIASYDIREFVY